MDTKLNKSLLKIRESFKSSDDLYGVGLLEMIMKDPFKYRGKGRPRLIDYSPFSEIQRTYNRRLNEVLNLKAKKLWMI